MIYEATAVTSDREAIVNSIITNLDAKRYGSKFCIAQELIQNADDAKAERLMLGYGRLSKAPHPLLAEDGVFFVNDGILTADDRKHLFKVATSNKTSEKDKIGHFGLGMKSVFHLSEAFFMFFEQPENRDQLRNDADFLDPRYDDREEESTPEKRREWHNAFGENGAALSSAVREYLSPWLEGWARWFCVWLPLRKDWMYDEHSPAFKNECLNWESVQELFSLKRSSAIAEILVFMKRLKQVTLLDAVKKEVIDVISVSADRRLCMKNGSLDMCLEHQSQILHKCIVKGSEKLYEQEVYTALMNAREWPRSTKRDSNGTFLPEKVTPHAALFWARSGIGESGDGAGVFSVKHCVFLPLTSEEQKYESEPHLPFDLTLCMHATLFVDAGRQDFHVSDDIKKRWNYLLVSNGLLAMVIPALEQAVASWKYEEITLAVTAFNKYLDIHDESHSEINYRKFITQQYQFLNCLTDEGWRWKKVSSSRMFMSIPYTQDPDLQHALMERFAIQELLLVSADSIGVTNGQTIKMDDTIFRRLRMMVEKMSVHIKYNESFMKWLEALVASYPLTQEQQTQLLVAFLNDIRLENFQYLQNDIYALMQCFPGASQKVYLARTNWDKVTFEQWKKIALLDGIIVIPVIFDYLDKDLPKVNDPSGKQIEGICQVNQIPDGDLEIIFKFISSKMTKAAQDEKQRNLFKNVIFTLINNCPGAENNEAIQDYKLFAFYDEDNNWDFFSLSKILSGREAIFLNGGESTMIPQIKRAAQIKYYRFIDSNLFFTDFMQRLGIGTFAFKDINRFFVPENLPKLNPEVDRLDLFKTLIGDDSLASYANIARYLLRDDPENFTNEDELLILSPENAIDPKPTEFWNNMLELLFDKTGLKKSTLPPVLTSELNSHAFKKLNITSLTRDEILRRLDAVEIGDTMPFDVNQRTWKYLANNFSRSDSKCCRVVLKLPLFPVNGDRFSRLDRDVFFNDRHCAVPEIFADKITTCNIRADELHDIFETAGLEQPVWSYAWTLAYCWKERASYPASELALHIREALFELVCETSSKFSNKTLLNFLREQDFITEQEGGFYAPVRDLILDNEKMLDFLKGYAFLVDQAGNASAPANILDLKKGEYPEIDEVFQQCGLYFLSNVANENISEKAWKWMRDHLFPHSEAYYEVLGKVLSCDKRFYIGSLEINEELSAALVNSELACDLLPAVKFARYVDRQLDELKYEKGSLEAFFKCLAKPLNSSRMIGICNDLLAKDAERPSALYLAYLQVLNKEKDFSSALLSRIKLVNANGKICNAAELIHSANGISASHILHRKCQDFICRNTGETKEIVERLPQHSNCHNLKYSAWLEKVQNTRAELDKCFSDWYDDFKQHIAALIALCDDSEEMQKYVKQHYWENADATNLRGMIQVPGEDLVKKYNGMRLYVDVYYGRSMEMTNLLGERISVSLAKNDELDSLLVGVPWYSCRYVYIYVEGREDGCKSVYLALRCLSEEERKYLGKDKLLELLEKTIRILVKEMAGPNSVPDSLLEYIRQKEQLDLEIVRDMILDGLHDYLPSLGIRGSMINEILNDWHALKRNKIQADQSKQVEQSNAYTIEIDNKKDELRQEVETNKQVQQDILNALITRMTEHCGYDFESIPFELFQNADDAVKEREILDENISRYQKMIIRLTESDLTVLHYGRPINKNLSNKDDDENARGFQDDLEKMLKLWRSDKEIGELKRTGKFGLGFKSVYQLTDSPLVSSAPLHFRIKGTLFPMKANEEERKKLKHLSETMRNAVSIEGQMPPETLIYLPIRDGITVKGYGDKRTEETAMRLNSFIDAADLLVIFSRAIKEIAVIDRNTVFSFANKKEKTEHGMDIISTGSGKAFGIICLKKSGVTIAFGYNQEDKCIQPLDENYATVWITEPTQERYNLGFAVNGSFAVDIGRNNLMANNMHNEELAKQAGTDLYHFLAEQYRKSSFHEKWLESLWKCFSGAKSGQWGGRNKNGIGNYLPNIIWGSRELLRGYGKFISEFPAIPSDFNYAQKAYLKLDECKFYCHEDLLKESVWQLFEPFTEGKIQNTVSAKTGEALQHILNIQLEEISGLTILKQWFSRHSFLTPEKINDYPWQKIIAYCKEKKADYEKELIPLLSKCEFLSQKGTRRFARAFMCGDGSYTNEIKYLLGFADEEFILSEQYSEDAMALFTLANNRQNVPIQRIMSWATAAKTDQAMEAVRKYLVYGKHSLELAMQLQHEKNLESWLQQAIDSRLLCNSVHAESQDSPTKVDNTEESASAPATAAMIVSMQEKGIITDEADIPGEGPENICKMTPTDLEWLRDNWPDYRQEIVSRYNKENYGVDTDTLKPLPLSVAKDDLANRQRWMELLILAMCKKMGRQKAVQHFGFIQKCRILHWMDIFAAPDAPIEEKSLRWIQLLDNCYDKYTGAPEMYSHWMQLYPWIYQANKYLDKYLSVFNRMNRTSFNPKDVKEIFNPAGSAAWDGADVKVPPLQYGLGHIGPYWLIRELIRSGTVTNSNLYRYCFVPATTVTILFGDPAITSEEIFALLNGETFDLNFNIAFIALRRRNK